MGEGKGDDGVSRLAGLLQLINQLGLEFVGFVELEFASSNFVRTGPVIAELANTESAFGADWRPEHPAGDRPPLIDVTGALFRIEGRAWLKVGKFLEGCCGLVVRAKKPCSWITGELFRQALPTFKRTLAHAGGALWVVGIERGQTFLKAEDVELIDGEDSDAARCASGLADQPFPAAPFRVEKSGIDDLDELLVLGGERVRHRT